MNRVRPLLPAIGLAAAFEVDTNSGDAGQLARFSAAEGAWVFVD
ncbi:MAG: hypothetical protein ACR2O6_11690 [Ilumatobacteraceae bacterium]